MGKTALDKFNNSWYQAGPIAKRLIWHYVSLFVFESGLFPTYAFKVFLLRIFGAKIGTGVCIKPHVHIKYPWRLTVGNHVWIGEGVWIDNLAEVYVGDHVCISQGAYLLTGNHDFTSPAFDLRIGKIELHDGVWIGAKSVVCPGVTCASHAVLTVGSVANKNLDAYTIYRGNPAVAIRTRTVKDE